MGRHRRVDPAAAATPAVGHHGSHRRRRGAPVRTGILGATGALAVGAVAVASGMVPGVGSSFGDDQSGGTRVQAEATPELDLDGPPLERETDAPPSRDDARSAPSPSSSGSEDGAKESGTPESGKDSKDTPDTDEPSGTPSADTPSSSPSAKPSSPPSTTPSPTPSSPEQTTPAPTRPPSEPGPHSPAENEVLTLVNQERARAGCQPVQADTSLASLARDHSKDMAERGYFSHTDPDGNSPWDRAKARGVQNLGAENIARGQADAGAVMAAWMDSPGHRANILNCDYTTLGVGAHHAQGGPWWTQSFGF